MTTTPPPDQGHPDWTADLEEIADLAAGMAAPAAAAAPAPGPVERGPSPLPWSPRRRLFGTGLAVVAGLGFCGTVLWHLPGPDPAAPLSGSPGYTTPSPYAGGAATALAPLQLDPTSPAPLLAPTPLSARASHPAVAPPPPAGVGAVPVPPPGVRSTPVAPGRASALPTPPPAAAPSPTPVPAPSPTTVMTASPSPSAAPAGPVRVRSVSLTVGTCSAQGAWWVCPETTVFTFDPGSAGTLIYSIGGVEVSCTGTAATFDQPQKRVSLPQGTIRATISSALVFPAADHPAAGGPGSTPSTAEVRVSSPNRVTSASEPFGSASCP